MKKENFEVNQSKTVFFETRNEAMLSCPHCWTEQRSDRDFCYQCGAHFHFTDEESKADKPA